ncbi:MAG: fumarate hydratase [Promethearchaeota archaeon]
MRSKDKEIKVENFKKVSSLSSEKIYSALKKVLERNAISVAPELIKLLKDKLEIEEKSGNNIATEQLKLIIKNFNYAIEHKLPACQDTGMINILVRFNPDFSFPRDFKDTIIRAIRDATEEIPLRPNCVDPVLGTNSSDNTGHLSPPIYYELDDNVELLEIDVLNKGGGAENMSQLLMLNASVSLKRVKDEVVRIIKEAGGKPCPPVILGIGLGGDATYSMFLAKKALMRPLFSRSEKKEVRQLEDELLEELNRLNVGVMGLGGRTTCLDVRIEWAMRHPASFPVGVIVQCYSHRGSKVVFKRDGNILYEYL